MRIALPTEQRNVRPPYHRHTIAGLPSVERNTHRMFEVRVPVPGQTQTLRWYLDDPVLPEFEPLRTWTLYICEHTPQCPIWASPDRISFNDECQLDQDIFVGRYKGLIGEMMQRITNPPKKHGGEILKDPARPHWPGVLIKWDDGSIEEVVAGSPPNFESSNLAAVKRILQEAEKVR